MRRILAAFLVVLFATPVGWVTPTAEARMKLNGDYASTQSRSCTVSTIFPFVVDGSGAPTLIPGPVPPFVFRQNAVDTSTVTFNADGTGSITGVSKTMNITNTTPNNSIYSVSENSTPFTYVVNPDDTVDLSLDTTTSKTIKGAGTGNMVTVSPRLVRYKIGNGGNTLVSGQNADIAQETLTFTPPVGPPFTQWRLCTRSTTLVKE